MYVYRIAISILAFLNSRLEKAAQLQYKAAREAQERIYKLEELADEAIADGEKAERLAQKIDQLVH